MTGLLIVLGIAAYTGVIGFLLYHEGYTRGEQRGYRDGYDDGRAAERAVQ